MNREPIYRAAAVSRNALQLTETFPLLALAVYTPNHPASYGNFWWPSEWEHWELPDRISEASRLIERGARLREVAAVMNIPMALRCVVVCQSDYGDGAYLQNWAKENNK